MNGDYHLLWKKGARLRMMIEGTEVSELQHGTEIIMWLYTQEIISIPNDGDGNGQ